jgi:hypothetical protein
MKPYSIKKDMKLKQMLFIIDRYTRQGINIIFYQEESKNG